MSPLVERLAEAILAHVRKTGLAKGSALRAPDAAERLARISHHVLVRVRGDGACGVARGFDGLSAARWP
jgi:hypothetical protein